MPRVALLECRGDWQWFGTAFHFRTQSSERICWMCDAGKGAAPCSFAEVSAGATWRGTAIAHEEFCGRCASSGAPVSSLFDTPGFRVDMILVDVLHTLDLGVSQWVAGAVLHDFLREPSYGGTVPVRLHRLQRELDQWRRATRARGTVDRLSVKMIQRPGESPTLHAKAAETRRLVPFLQWLCDRFEAAACPPDAVACPAEEQGGTTPAGGPHGGQIRCARNYYQMRRLCVEALNTFYMSLRGRPFSVPAAVRAGERVLRLYAALHDRVRNQRPQEGVERRVEADGKPWPIKPKLHLFDHLVHDVIPKWGSPALYWTYRDEDFMGQLVRMAVRTPHPSTLAGQILQKNVLYNAFVHRTGAESG